MLPKLITFDYAISLLGGQWREALFQALHKREIKGRFGSGEYGAESPTTIETVSLRDYFINNYGKDLLEEAETSASISGKWPWGDHETELLKKLADAASKFWVLYDPDDHTTAPTNQQVIDWLMEQGVAKRTAAVMATILRADGLPTGPRK